MMIVLKTGVSLVTSAAFGPSKPSPRHSVEMAKLMAKPDGVDQVLNFSCSPSKNEPKYQKSANSIVTKSYRMDFFT